MLSLCATARRCRTTLDHIPIALEISYAYHCFAWKSLKDTFPHNCFRNAKRPSGSSVMTQFGIKSYILQFSLELWQKCKFYCIFILSNRWNSNTLHSSNWPTGYYIPASQRRYEIIANTPPWFAVPCGHERYIKPLLANNIKADIMSSLQRNSLMYASENGRDGVIRYSLKHVLMQIVKVISPTHDSGIQ